MQRLVSLLMLIVAISLGAVEAQAQSPGNAGANNCVSVETNRSGSQRVLRNTCSYAIMVTHCTEDYRPHYSPDEVERSDRRNCGSGTRYAHWNPSGYWFTFNTIRPGDRLETYASTRSGSTNYAACRAKVDDRLVRVVGAATGGRYSCEWM